MSEEIERHVVRKFEICQRLGKGVRYNIFVFDTFGCTIISNVLNL